MDDHCDVVDVPLRPRVSRRGIASLLGLVLLVNLSMSLYQLPLNRVVERRLCREYYASRDPTGFRPDGEVDEELCKVDAVQRELAWIQGAMETAWIVGDFVMTIPLGFIAERYGRQRVLWLNLVPRICMLLWAVTVGYFEHLFPTKAIIASPILSILGGECVFSSIVYALASDLADDPIRRATYFAYMGSTTYVVALLGPALASATMSILLWLPFFIGVGLLVAAIWAISALPERRPSSSFTNDGGEEESRQPLLSSPVLKAQDAHQSLRQAIAKRFTVMKTILTSHPRNFTLLLTSMFLTSLASADTKLLAQYISKRYHWTFASAGYLLSSKAVVNFVLLTIVIPRLLRWRAARQRGSSQDNAHLTYAKICMLISVLGAAAIALAGTVYHLFPSLLLYALGSALPIFTLSLLKSRFVSPPQPDTLGADGGADTQVFAIVMLVKTLGSLFGAPIMAAVWIRGIAVGGDGLGLPYFVSAICYALAFVVVCGIRLG